MKRIILIFCIICLLIFHFSFFNCSAQSDTLKTKKHSPKTASWLALIPGAGQIYNKKYWKLPIVYGGLGATSYLIYHFNSETNKYRKEYLARVNDGAIFENPDLEEKTTAQVLDSRNYHRRNMEISIAACAIVYLLSIIDASVDAHLFYYDISDDLSLGIKPKIEYHPISRATTPSIALVFKF